MTTTRRVFLSFPAMLAAQNILELPPPPDGEHIGYGPGQFQFGELRVPAGAGPHRVVIVIHGGYWRAAYDLRHTGHLCAAIAAAGMATWSLEYRRLGNRGGGWPGTFDDIRVGAAHLNKIAKEKSLDLTHVVATGHSAGGHLVLWLAKQKAVALRGIVPLAPVADLRRAYELRLSGTVVGQLLGGSPAEQPDRYRLASPPDLLPLGVKQRLIHGQDDNIVPISISRGYVEAARAKGDDATLTEPRGAGHFELIDPRSAAWPVVRDALTSLLS
jgi:acetyl esterase/lipase